jgi:hypothetical protein
MTKQYEFTKNYEEHKKGSIIEYDAEQYHIWIHPLVMKGILKIVGKKVKNKEAEEAIKEYNEETKEVMTSDNENIITQLSGMKMQTLREFGNKYGAADTKKSELIDEILAKAPDNDIQNFIQGDK